MDHPSISKKPRIEDDNDSSVSDLEDLDFDIIENDSDFDSDIDNDENIHTVPSTILPDVLQWSNTKVLPKSISYSKTPGMKIQMTSKEPIDYFNLIFSTDLYNHIINQSNLYAVEVLSKSKGETSRITRWKDVTEDEMRVWLGLLLHTGTIRLNRLNDYWKTDYLFNLPIFSQFMARDRFLLILRALHFNNNEENSSSMAKISTLIDFFNKRMHTIYEPHKNLTIDESLLLWRGRLLFRQYMKGKKAKYGIKLYMLGESNGLALKLIVYDGSSDTELGGKNHTEKVVHKLLDGKTGAGHSIYMDNFYNSVTLSKKLLNQNTYTTGTLRVNRKDNPIDVTNKKLKKGETVSQYTKDGICVSKWKDRQKVIMISSEFDGELSPIENRRGEMVAKPNMVISYNKYMGGVDHHDHMLSYYPCKRKTLRWYKKLAIHLFQTILINSWHLFNLEKEQKMPLYDFRLCVIKQLLGPPLLSIPNQPVLSKIKIHLPKQCDKDGSNKTKRRRCKQCWDTDKKRNTTLYLCPDCPSQPGLCLEPCFRIYHNY